MPNTKSIQNKWEKSALITTTHQFFRFYGGGFLLSYKILVVARRQGMKHDCNGQATKDLVVIEKEISHKIQRRKI